MWLDEIDKKIEDIVELVRPEIKGELYKLLKELRDETIKQTVFEFKKGMDSLTVHIEKHIVKPNKTEISEKITIEPPIEETIPKPIKNPKKTTPIKPPKTV